ncbi:unnamed protein product [Didymodactylos carnosus]|uniref:Uncharacterized protein n=1 Tax=Didymodactylos carnosus TaxID=1234261 RepID=A0A813NKN4_9BILA|nr:unnamed protein product [Didymodactylos carnosus]CAF3515917.1 unnamed protein product [Didymodactylos carnosus]
MSPTFASLTTITSSNTNIDAITQKKNPNFNRNSSYPTTNSLINTNQDHGSMRKYLSASAINDPHVYPYKLKNSNKSPSIEQYHHRSTTLPSLTDNIIQSSKNVPFFHRLKQRVSNLLKHVVSNTQNQQFSRQNPNEAKMATVIETVNDDDVDGYQNMTYFDYDDELDITEENELMLTNRLLDVLRESKLKHLNCGDLFVPCNHIKNISKQMLMMAAEEPFGIHGAKINIKLLSKQRDEEEKLVQTIKVDATKQSTFEIEIQLHEDQKIFSLRRFLSLMTKSKMKLIEQLKNRSPIYISPNCKLIKTRYYCHEKPKVAYVKS